MKSPAELMTQELSRLCQSYNLTVTAQILESLGAHFELLLKWNKKISLTTIVTPEQAALQLYFEPIFAAGRIEPGLSTAADVGSGGGFPGLPVALLRPELAVTLIESDRRKAAFLREARRLLGLGNLEVVNARFEKVEMSYELVMARAIERFEAQTARLLQFCSHSRQVLLFLSRSAGARLIEPPDSESSLSGWRAELVPLPESRNRALLLLSRST